MADNILFSQVNSPQSIRDLFIPEVNDADRFELLPDLKLDTFKELNSLWEYALIECADAIIACAVEGQKTSCRGAVFASISNKDGKVSWKFVYISFKEILGMRNNDLLFLCSNYKPDSQIVFILGDLNFKECPMNAGILTLQADRQEVVNVVNEMQERSKAPVKKRQSTEQEKELALYDWMRLQGFHVERQVTTGSKHRLDLWIPGTLMLELKGGKISSDDILQAVDYYATYEKPIVLVGTGMSNSACRGLDALSKIISADAINFVSWGAIKSYLLGLSKIRVN